MLGVDLGTTRTVAVTRGPDGRSRPLEFGGRPFLPTAAGTGPAAVLTAIADAIGGRPPAAITHPADWAEHQRAALAEAWPAALLVPQPHAAARYYSRELGRPLPDGASLAVIDVGGSTLDVAVVRNTGDNTLETTGSSTLALDLDAALVNHLGMTLRRSAPAVWSTLKAADDFRTAVREAKETLSHADEATLTVPGLDSPVRITRDELDMVAGPLLSRGITSAAAVIEAAGLSPEQLAGVLLVGGGSRVPLIAGLLEQELGVEPTVPDQPELALAEGALHTPGLPAVPEPPAAGGPQEPGETAAIVVPPATAAAAADPLASAETVKDAAGPLAPAGTVEDAAGPLAPAGTVEDAAGSLASAETVKTVRVGESGPLEAAPTVPTARRPAPGVPAPTGELPTTAAAASDETATGPALAPTGAHPAAAGLAATGAHSAAAAGGEPRYAEPVDPWADAEAEAMAAAHGGLPYPSSPGPYGPAWAEPAEPAETKRALRSYRGRGWWISVTAAVVVVGVAAGVILWAAWPAYPALRYRPLGESPRRVAAGVPVGSGFSAARVWDGRAFFAAERAGGELGVVAADAESGATVWSGSAGVAERWESLRVAEGVVLAATGGGPRKIVALGAGDGRKLWERQVDDDEGAFVAGGVLVVPERTAKKVSGVSLTDGRTVWEVAHDGTTVVPETVPEDVEGPAAPGMVVSAGKRIVLVGADGAVRVLDAATGAVAGTRAEVAEAGDAVLAYDGKLLVVADRLLAYRLGDLSAQPTVLYEPGRSVRLEALTPCGEERVCAVQETGYDATTARVVAISTGDGGGEAWHREAPGAESLAPVGESLLVGLDEQVELLGGDGAVAWSRAGVAGRIDGGNVLVFSKALTSSPDDPAVAGVHVGDDEVPLGALRDVRSSTCSWDDRHLACVADEDFVIYTYAG